jgi:hypothetical protein
MKVWSIAVATLMCSSTLALAQFCPPGSEGNRVCLVPSPTATGQPTIVGAAPMTGTVTVPYSGATTISGVPATGTMQGACANITPDTACLANQIAALQNELRQTRADIRAEGLIMRGTQLTTRLDQLIAEELAFRQQLAANPNWTGAQEVALQLESEANALNRDIAAFNRELGMIPADQRPFLASRVNTFDVVYWDPALQRFAQYRQQFPQTATVYQTASTQMPWLSTWRNNYQASLNNLSTTQQAIATTRWWTSPQVAGTMETLPAGTMQAQGTMMAPGGTVMMLPQGTALYIPPGSIPTVSTPTDIAGLPSGTTMGETPQPDGMAN